MHITRFSDYSLRVLIYAALNKENLCTIQDIADGYDISKNHLMKVVQLLNQLGYLEAIRGKNGGLRLGKSPELINLGQLIRDTEQDLSIVECFKAGDNCQIHSACKLKGVFHEALTAFLKVLDQYTLDDLLQPKQSKVLTQILKLS